MVTKQSCDHSSAKIMPTVQEKAKKEIIASPEGFKQEQMAEVGTCQRWGSFQVSSRWKGPSSARRRL